MRRRVRGRGGGGGGRILWYLPVSQSVLAIYFYILLKSDDVFSHLLLDVSHSVRYLTSM